MGRKKGSKNRPKDSSSLKSVFEDNQQKNSRSKKKKVTVPAKKSNEKYRRLTPEEKVWWENLNSKCLKCQENCKQSDKVIVAYCPSFKKVMEK
jgi:hypothetical protein